MGPPTAEDQVNQIMRMMEKHPRGVPNPNRNMMFTSNNDEASSGSVLDPFLQRTRGASSGTVLDDFIQGTREVGTSIHDSMEESVAASKAAEKARFNALSGEERAAEIAANKARAVAVGEILDLLDPVTNAIGEVSGEIGGFLNDRADDYSSGSGPQGYGSLAAFLLRSLGETVMPESEFPPQQTPDEDITELLEKSKQSQIDHGERMREIKSAREDRALRNQYHRDRQRSVRQTILNRPTSLAASNEIPEPGFPVSFEEYKAREQQELDEFKKRQQEDFETLARMGGF